MKLVRSTVNEHRRRSLEILKEVMEEKADESKYKYEHQLLPYKIIKSATEGDVDAVYAVLKHYDGYIETLSKRKMYDEFGAGTLLC